jgi:hypothetical protein
MFVFGEGEAVGWGLVEDGVGWGFLEEVFVFGEGVGWGFLEEVFPNHEAVYETTRPLQLAGRIKQFSMFPLAWYALIIHCLEI